MCDPIAHSKVDRRKNVEHKCHNKRQEKLGCSEKNCLRFNLSTKKLVWIFLGAKASLAVTIRRLLAIPLLLQLTEIKKRNGTCNGN